MSIKATVKTQKSSLKGINQSDVQRTLNRVGIDSVNHIRQRTQKGLDVNNNSFVPYKDSTKRHKNKIGAQTSPVNLKQSSLMLRSLTFSKIKDGIKIFLNNRQNIGAYHQYGQGKLPKRKWFGLNRQTQQKIISNVFNTIKLKFTNKIK